MDIWEELYERAKAEYHPEMISPFFEAHHVVSAIESESGEIFTGFCIEGASGVLNLCAERVAILDMYHHSGQLVVSAIKLRSEAAAECRAARAASFLCSYRPKTDIPK